MKSMKSLTMKQRLKVCAIMLWRVLFELCVDIPVGAILLSVGSVITLGRAIFSRENNGDILEECKSAISSTLRATCADLKCRFDVKLLVDQILEKEFPDEEEP